ncbi:MAG: PEP-CTERM sorting domain-containing protein [Tepidisphaeraceae bacterium]
MHCVSRWCFVGVLCAGAGANAATLVKLDGLFYPTGLQLPQPSTLANHLTFDPPFGSPVNSAGNAMYQLPNLHTDIMAAKASATSYTEVTLGTLPGFEMVLTGFRVKVGANKFNGTDPITALGVWSSLNGYSSSAPLGIGYAIDTSLDGTASLATLDVPIDNARTGSITFQLYSAGNVPWTQFDDLEVLGTVVPVPEPVTALALLATGALLSRRRQVRHRAAASTQPVVPRTACHPRRRRSGNA